MANKGLFENTKNSLKSEKIELYTPKFMVDVIIPYLKKDWVIWAPFDLESSNFVRYLRDKGFKVIYSHILNNQSFINCYKVGNKYFNTLSSAKNEVKLTNNNIEKIKAYEPKEKYDVIISNPPFKDKSKWVDRCIELNKPFAFILPLMWMNDISWNEYWNKVDMKIIIPDQRISFDGSTKTASFKSAYFSNLDTIKEKVQTIKIFPKEEIIPMYDEVKKIKEKNNGNS